MRPAPPPSAAPPALPFLRVAIPFGVLLALCMAPFQVADESRHFIRAWQIATGHPVAEVEGGVPVVRISKDVLTGVKSYDFLRWRGERRLSPAQILADLRRPRAPRPEVVAELDAGAYSPAAYLPQLPGLLLGRALGAPVLALLYLGRLSSLAVTLSAMALFLSMLPLYRRSCTLLLLLPMSLSQCAAVSADGVVLAACLLLTGILVSAALGARRIGAGAVAALVALSAVIALSKAVYLLLLGLVFLVPRERLPRPRQVALFLLLCAVGLLALRGWAQLSYARGLAPTSAAGRGHLDQLLASPLRALLLVGKTYVLGLPWLLQTFVGRLGWLDVALPWPLILLYAAALVASALGEDPAPPWSTFQRAVLLGLCAAVLLAVALGLFVYSGYTAADEIEGMQGRYFLPIGALVLLSLAQRRWPRVPRWVERHLGPRLGWGAALGLLVTLLCVLGRYYGA